MAVEGTFVAEFQQFKTEVVICCHGVSYDTFQNNTLDMQLSDGIKNTFSLFSLKMCLTVWQTGLSTNIKSNVMKDLNHLHDKFAHEDFLSNKKKLVDRCPEFAKHIPDLNKLDEIIHVASNFHLKPVNGYVEPKIFLFDLSDRIFPCIQNIRQIQWSMYAEQP
ncbi:hypothetical protein GJ496_003063, partial [Pomphorhynchus laevis]